MRKQAAFQPQRRTAAGAPTSGACLMAVFLVYVAAVFGLFAVLAFVEEWLTGRGR